MTTNAIALSPVPYQTPITASQGLLTIQWQAFFRQLTALVIAASQIDATAAAEAAEAAATAAASSAASAASDEAGAATYANNAATSATQAATSASAAAVSAADAAASAAEATGQGFAPYIFTSPITVPQNYQWIVFGRVSLLPGGILQMNGRGRVIV